MASLFAREVRNSNLRFVKAEAELIVNEYIEIITSINVKKL